MYFFRFQTLDPHSVWVWIVAALMNDHFYYWEHRFLHETHIGWAAHQVHHSSEDFNLATGVRQSMVQKFFSPPFYIPMALLGIAPQLFMIHLGVSLIYQFWIHTELFDGFGPVYNYFFNVPKHHQVHHGINPHCVDKNYAGVLIIWDRIYGKGCPRNLIFWIKNFWYSDIKFPFWTTIFLYHYSPLNFLTKNLNTLTYRLITA